MPSVSPGHQPTRISEHLLHPPPKPGWLLLVNKIQLKWYTNQCITALCHPKWLVTCLRMLIPLLSTSPFQALFQILDTSWWVNSSLGSGVSVWKHAYFWTALTNGGCFNNYTITKCFGVFSLIYSAFVEGSHFSIYWGPAEKFLVFACILYKYYIWSKFLRMCFWIYSCHYI